MINAIFAIALIAAFIAAEALIDYVFGAIYALAIAGVVNALVRIVKYYVKHKRLCTDAIGSGSLYFLMGIGAYILWGYYFA